MHFKFPKIFRRICLCIDFKFVNQENIHICVFVSVTRKNPQKGAGYAYLIQIDGAQNFSRMCMCTAILILVLKQKSVHVSPVGMVRGLVSLQIERS